MPTKNEKAFAKLDIQKYAGKCIGFLDGKIALSNADPEMVMKKLKHVKNKEVAIICIPSTKNVMVI